MHVEDSTDDSDIDEHESPLPVSNTLWCSYAQCIPQATECECVCRCQELEDVLCIFSQESGRLTSVYCGST